MDSKHLSLTIAAAAVLVPCGAQACAVCMGGSDSNVATAINGAIFLMLGFVGCMLASVGGLIFYLARRAKHPLDQPENFAAIAAQEVKQHA